MIKGLFFDFYDTLCYVNDAVYFEGKKKMADVLGVEMELFFSEWRKTGMDSLIGKLGTTKERIMKVAFVLGINLSSETAEELEKIDWEYLHNAAELYPNTEKVLNMLKRERFKLGIISNASDTVETLRKKFNLQQYFDVINFSYQLKTKKPDKPIYLSALESLGLTPEESVYTGDGNDSELDTAYDLGFKTILITQKRNDRFRNAESNKYHHEINDISEIFNIINEE
mgnify:CR=1 FL=1